MLGEQMRPKEQASASKRAGEPAVRSSLQQKPRRDGVHGEDQTSAAPGAAPRDQDVHARVEERDLRHRRGTSGV